MSKPFLENMKKEERQAFSYLEKLIIQSKIECLAAIPKTRVYDDSTIFSKINELEGKVKTIYHNDGLEKDTFNFIEKILNITNLQIQEIGEIFMLLSNICTIIYDEKLGAEKQRYSIYKHIRIFTELIAKNAKTENNIPLKNILERVGWEYEKKEASV